MENDLISRSALIAEHCDGCDALANGLCDHDVCGAALLILEAPAIDPESLRPKGRWELEVKSFYRDTFDESCELVVYILATCSCCGGKHPNSHQVYSKNLYAPEDAEEDYRFDETAEMEKALAEFRDRNYVFANYCPNCGADMREGKYENHT